jgi:hypothetical protein
MLKKICLILLSLMPLTCFAEWTYMATRVTDGGDVYLNPRAIWRKNDIVRVWLLYDFGRSYFSYTAFLTYGKEVYFMSTIGQTEYDCRYNRKRDLAATHHDAPMGAGKIVHALNDPTSWSQIKTNTPDDVIFKKVCSVSR